MKTKIWIFSVGIVLLLISGIVLLGYKYHTSQMKTFGEGYGLKLIDQEIMFAKSGPFFAGRNMQIYQAFYQDSLDKAHVFWFQFGGLDTYIYEEISGQYFKMKQAE